MSQWTSYGWNVFTLANGNDYGEVTAALKAMDEVDPHDRRPIVAIGKTDSQNDGSILWFADWMGGPSLSKIENCRIENLHGEPRVTAYVQDDPDTYFSQPAKCYLFGKVLVGYLTGDNSGGNTVFHAQTKHF